MVTLCHLKKFNIGAEKKKCYFYLNIKQKSAIIYLCILETLYAWNTQIAYAIFFSVYDFSSSIPNKLSISMWFTEIIYNNDWKFVRHLLLTDAAAFHWFSFRFFFICRHQFEVMVYLNWTIFIFHLLYIYTPINVIEMYVKCMYQHTEWERLISCENETNEKSAFVNGETVEDKKITNHAYCVLIYWRAFTFSRPYLLCENESITRIRVGLKWKYTNDNDNDDIDVDDDDPRKMLTKKWHIIWTKKKPGIRHKIYWQYVSGHP